MDRIINPKYIAIFRKYNKKHYNFDTVKNYDFHFPQKENERLSHYLIKSGLNRNNYLSETHSKLTTDPINDEKVSRYWKKDKLKILLCPQGSKRQIPENELAEFLNNSIPAPLLDKIDIIVGYTNTANEYTLRLRNLVPKIEINLSPKTTLSEYISLISSADFVIAVDGGSLHIACAFQKPLLSFFAKSQPNMGTWKPLLAPTIPHLRVITNDDVGSNSNLTENFDLVPAIAWFNHYLKNKYNRDYK
ncbi:glycosyltransferase family 9 protein [Glaesserella parasuis]|uniref:glycosyltransferase family 9 protein n=1 Tax=Glaesserella parasuis TaxID=738 RepID=UPI00385285F2